MKASTHSNSMGGQELTNQWASLVLSVRVSSRYGVSLTVPPLVVLRATSLFNNFSDQVSSYSIPVAIKCCAWLKTWCINRQCTYYKAHQPALWIPCRGTRHFNGFPAIEAWAYRGISWAPNMANWFHSFGTKHKLKPSICFVLAGQNFIQQCHLI